jgi:hypothetical protein
MLRNCFHQAPPLPRVSLEQMATEHASCCSWIRWRPQLGDQPQNLGEHHSGHSDLGHLERNVASVADNGTRRPRGGHFRPRHHSGARNRQQDRVAIGAGQGFALGEPVFHDIAALPPHGLVGVGQPPIQALLIFIDLARLGPSTSLIGRVAA